MALFDQRGNTLALSDGVSRRTWQLAKGLLCSRSVFGLPAAREESRNAISFAHLTTDYSDNKSTIVFNGITERFVAQEPFMAPHKLGGIRFIDEKRGLRLTWQFRLFPDTFGLESFIDVRTLSLPMNDWRTGRREDRLDVIPVNTSKASLHLVAYNARTDHHNEFVSLSEYAFKGSAPFYLDGNILRLEQPDGTGLVIMKAGPGPRDRREKIAANFRVERDAVVVLGWGLEPTDFQIGRTLRSHSVIIVPYRDGEPGAMSAVRAFWRQRRQHAFNSPRTVMVNPWGGGGNYLYRHFSDSFLIREIKAASLLHATHYQIDDGWQAGGTLADITRAGLVAGRNYRRNYWKINPVKFPNGFTRVVKAAGNAGIDIGLWFCPNANQNYINWKDEADWLVAFHRRYGIDFFKIDGVWHRTRQAELNLDRLLRRVFEKTGGKVYFNFDVTEGIRLGFMHAPEFGPLFPANRYPQSPRLPGKYYPSNTLRNFWRMAQYIPAHLIQVEIPNILFNPAEFGQRKTSGYKNTDLHHPLKYGPAYCAAIALFGSPLLWFQPSRTNPALIRAYGKIMKIFHGCREQIVAGNVYPIGREPDGRSITGFASVREKSGYAVIFRETGPSARARLQVPGAQTAALNMLASSAPAKAVLKNGIMEVRLPKRRSFALFRW